MDLALQSITVSIYDWQKEFRHHLNGCKLAPKSRSSALQHIHVFSLWYEAKFNQIFDPAGLTNYDLHLYRAWSLDQEKVKANTWNSRLWAFAILCNWIGEPSLLDGIEAKACVRGSIKHRSLTDNEYHRLIHTLEQNTRRAVTEFEYVNAVRIWAGASLLLHGLRVEEATMVRADDITLGERSGSILVRNGKGSKERTVPLNLLARKAIGEWQRISHISTTNELLLGISVRTLQRTVSELGSQIGVPDLTPHWLRYTFAKRLERGATLETIRDLLGHSSIEQTKRYLRSSLEELQSAVEGVM